MKTIRTLLLGNPDAIASISFDEKFATRYGLLLAGRGDNLKKAKALVARETPHLILVCVHEIDHGWAELISSIEDGIFIIIACRPPLAFELPAHSTALPIPYELSDWEAALGTAQAFVNQSLHVQFSDDRICFQLTGAQYAFVESGKLMYVEADGQVSYAMLEDGTRLVVAHNIGYYKPVLLRQFQFMEISKSLMVNPRHIFRYSHRERALTLISGATLDASEQGARTLHKYVRQFHQVQQNGL